MANPAQLDPGPQHDVARALHRPAHAGGDVPAALALRIGAGRGHPGADLPAGPVTLLRIGGKSMDRLWLAEGDILRSGDAENLCRTQAEVQLTRGGHVTDLLRAPLGNHLVLVPGHHLDRLQSWGGLLPSA